MITKYTPPCCRAGYVPSTALSRRSNKVVLLDCLHRVNALKTTNYANVVTISCPTTWRRVDNTYWPYTVIANDVIVTLAVLQMHDWSPKSRPVASLNQSQTQLADATGRDRSWSLGMQAPLTYRYFQTRWVSAHGMLLNFCFHLRD